MEALRALVYLSTYVVHKQSKRVGISCLNPYLFLDFVMKRKIYDRLLLWKNRRKGKSAASDADEGAAWFASPAGFGSESPFFVGDANGMDESSASLTGDGMHIAGSALAAERIRVCCDCSLPAGHAQRPSRRLLPPPRRPDPRRPVVHVF